MHLIDLESDTLEPVSAIAKARTGKRPAPSTIWRWVRKGCRGVRLEAIQHSSVWMTTPAAFADFLRRQTDHALGPRESADDESLDEALAAEGLL
jgi:hypothetical protein